MRYCILFLLVSLASAIQWCPDEDVNDDLRGLCYKYNPQPMTFDYARQWCLRRNYDLASIHSADQNTIIAAYAQQNLDDTYGFFWIGAQNTGDWNWVDNSPFNYSNWDRGEPIYSLAAVQMATANWDTYHPTSSFPFVCATPGAPVTVKPTTKGHPTQPPRTTAARATATNGQTNNGGFTSGPWGPTGGLNTKGPGQGTVPPVTAEPWGPTGGLNTNVPRQSTVAPVTPGGPGSATCPPPNKGNCPSDWTYFASTSSCYMRLFSESWSSAEDLCTQLGGHLASIHSKAEGSFIARLARTGMDASSFNQMTWIGLSYDGTQWNWSDGSNNKDFINWAPKYPLPGSTNPCVAVSQDNEQESWINGNCEILQRAYVCKKPM